MELSGKNYEVVDELNNIPIVDSFVKYNKAGRGSGEARLYVGAQAKENFDEFFEDFIYPGVFLKKDLRRYLDDAKYEYDHKEQDYNRDITPFWSQYYGYLDQLQEEIFFYLEKVSDEARYYIRSRSHSDDNIFYGYFRSILLPNISSVSILKLKSDNEKFLYLFVPELNYNFDKYHHPAREREVKKTIESKKIPVTTKQQLIKARVGQGEYRKKLLEESSECVITRVTDERLLIASHIKPWTISTDEEKIDPNNGLALTPTYDKLFDQGFISFTDDGEVMISEYISPLNIKKLGLRKGQQYKLPQSDARKEFLEYHRRNIFKS